MDGLSVALSSAALVISAAGYWMNRRARYESRHKELFETFASFCALVSEQRQVKFVAQMAVKKSLAQAALLPAVPERQTFISLLGEHLEMLEAGSKILDEMDIQMPKSDDPLTDGDIRKLLLHLQRLHASMKVNDAEGARYARMINFLPFTDFEIERAKAAATKDTSSDNKNKPAAAEGAPVSS
jgi:hypothetical protein